MDYYLDECEITRQKFDLEELLEFQLEHDVQLIRGDDYMYHCYINKKAYGTSLTPLLALVYGVESYKKHNGLQEKNN